MTQTLEQSIRESITAQIDQPLFFARHWKPLPPKYGPPSPSLRGWMGLDVSCGAPVALNRPRT